MIRYLVGWQTHQRLARSMFLEGWEPKAQPVPLAAVALALERLLAGKSVARQAAGCQRGPQATIVRRWPANWPGSEPEMRWLDWRVAGLRPA